MKKIVLASQSPRRKQLLEWAELPFDIIIKETDETYPAGLTMEETAIHIARQKGFAVRSLAPPGAIILAADTIVVFNNRIIGKPRSREEAISTLMDLSGQQHTVITGVVISRDANETAFFASTDVCFHEITMDQAIYYTDHYKPYDKAGAYAIQEWIGVVGIRSINGDFYNVMGLPISRVVQELNKMSNSIDSI
jgi:septum formation protein